jgi:hypothetical protein
MNSIHGHHCHLTRVCVWKMCYRLHHTYHFAVHIVLQRGCLPLVTYFKIVSLYSDYNICIYTNTRITKCLCFVGTRWLSLPVTLSQRSTLKMLLNHFSAIYEISRLEIFALAVWIYLTFQKFLRQIYMPYLNMLKRLGFSSTETTL